MRFFAFFPHCPFRGVAKKGIFAYTLRRGVFGVSAFKALFILGFQAVIWGRPNCRKLVLTGRSRRIIRTRRRNQEEYGEKWRRRTRERSNINKKIRRKEKGSGGRSGE